MSNIFKAIIATLILAISLLVTNTGASASTTGNISIDPILDAPQRDDIKSYFYRETGTSNYSESLKFLVRNKSDESINIEIYPVNSLTSPTGVIDYRPERVALTSKLIDEVSYFDQYVKLDKTTLSLEPGAAEVVTLDVNIPEVVGTMLGGLAFKTIDENVEQTESNFQINQEIVNVVAVLVKKQSKVNEPILQYGEVTVRDIAGKYFINLPTTLDSKSLITKAAVAYKVRDYKGDLLFEAQDTSGFSFTPDSFADITLPWNGRTLDIGEEYHLKGHFQYMMDGKKITAPFSKTFKVSKAELEGEPDLLTELNDKNILKIILIILILLLLLLLLALLMRKKYVLHDNEEIQVFPTINEDDLLFPAVVVYKKSNYKNEKGYLYFYKLKKYKDDKGNKRKQYVYVETKKLDSSKK